MREQVIERGDEQDFLVEVSDDYLERTSPDDRLPMTIPITISSCDNC